MTDHIIRAKCVDKAFDSRNAFNYIPGDVCEFNVTTGRVTLNSNTVLSFDRQLFWGKTPGGKWTFEFDRANSSNTALHIFFCTECGQPFDKLNEIGTHAREKHSNTKTMVGKSEVIEADAEEERLLAERRAAEASEQVEVAK